MGSLRRPGPAPRWLAAAVGAAVLASVAGVAAARRGDGGGSPGAAPPGVPVPPAPPAAEPDAASAVRDLLDRRAAAVLRRDRAAFLATVDTGSASFRRSQARLFDALGGVPLRSWSYRFDPRGHRELSAAQRARYGGPLFVPDVVWLSYRIGAFGSGPTSTPMFLTFVRRPAGWLLGSDSDLDGAGLRSQREPWDFGPASVVTGRRSLVLGHRGSEPMLSRVAAEVDRAVPAVSAVWGTGWAQRVVVVAPASPVELTALLGEDRDVSGLAAVATAWYAGPAGAGPVPAGQRVLLNPVTFARLGPLGRQVVLTHEITHLATRVVSAPGAPSWLVEGFADYVAYRSAGLPVRRAAAELAAEVRTGRLPAELPPDASFQGTGSRLARAYEEAWLACRLIADSAGPAGLVRFYRAGAKSGEPAVVLGRAFTDVLGTTQAGFTTRWRVYLRSQLS